MSRRVRVRVERTPLGAAAAAAINDEGRGVTLLVDPSVTSAEVSRLLQYLEVRASIHADRVSSPAHIDELPGEVTIPAQWDATHDDDRADMLVLPSAPRRSPLYRPANNLPADWSSAH